MAKVTLDMETFKALASQTRLQVLRSLDERRKTLSELSKELDLNKATVHEHLQILTATGLVKKRDDEGRKWIYYELTWQGERLLHPQETTTFAVLLGLGVASAGGGVAMLGRALHWWMAEQEVRRLSDGDQEDTEPENAPRDDSADTPQAAQQDAQETDQRAVQPEEPTGSDDGLWDIDPGDGLLSLLMFVTAAMLIVLAYVVRRSRRA